MHVSVLMSAFNEETTVEAAIESIRRQTYSDWDLVIVDDASTDRTASVLERLSMEDPRIRVLRHDANQGLAASLNEALHLSDGDLVARMDADDISLPRRLEKQVAFLIDHPSVDVLGTAAELMSDEGASIGILQRPTDHAELMSRFPRENPFIHPSVVVRRRFFDELGGYDEKLRRAQDWDLWARGMTRFRYANLEEPLIRYRVPERPTLAAIFYGSYVILRAGWRARRPMWFGLCAIRFFAASLASRAGLYSTWRQ